jgi:uncharacterized protein (TIGR02118 family)
MEKVVVLLNALPGLPAADFHERYLREQAPLEMAHQPRLRGFVLNLVDVPLSETSLDPATTPQPYQAIVELYLDDIADFTDPSRRWDSEDGAQARAAGAAALVSAEHAYHVFERYQKDTATWTAHAPSPGVKCIYLVRRAENVTHEAFDAHWANNHAPLARKHHIGVARYVQNPVLRTLTPGAPELDGFAELHFATYADQRERYIDSPEGLAIIRADVATFISNGSPHATTEYVLK